MCFLRKPLVMSYLSDISRRDFFPAFHIGNRLLVRRDELLDWLERQKVNKAQNENPKIVGSDE